MKKFIIILLVVGGLSLFAYNKLIASRCPDSDGDGLDDCQEETVYHTEKFNTDTDGDGYKDSEEVKQGYSPSYGQNIKLSEVDSDRDGLTDAEELKLKTDLLNPDTDGDGVSDYMEVQKGTDPLDGTKKDNAFLRLLKKLK